MYIPLLLARSFLRFQLICLARNGSDFSLFFLLLMLPYVHHSTHPPFISGTQMVEEVVTMLEGL